LYSVLVLLIWLGQFLGPVLPVDVSQSLKGPQGNLNEFSGDTPSSANGQPDFTILQVTHSPLPVDNPSLIVNRPLHSSQKVMFGLLSSGELAATSLSDSLALATTSSSFHVTPAPFVILGGLANNLR